MRAAAALGADTPNLSGDAGHVLAARVVEFMRRLEMPNGLSAIGYCANDIPALVSCTLPQHRVMKLSPMPVGEVELTELFRESMKIW